MDAQKEKFLRNEFLTMSVLGALGRSRTYSENATEEAKNRFRNALRKKLDEISRVYQSMVSEEEHISNLKNLSDDLTSRFHHHLRNGRFRIGVAQKALNLYLKYLWCVNLIPSPPHCPFDSIVVRYLPYCSDLNWTSIDTIEEYTRLVEAARREAVDKTLIEWEHETWLHSVQSERERKGVSVERKQIKRRTKIDTSMRPLATKYHNQFADAMLPYEGQILIRNKVVEILIGRFPDLLGMKDWLYPSDHCLNHTNKGACYCAETEKAIFERLRHGEYRVIGSKHLP